LRITKRTARLPRLQNEFGLELLIISLSADLISRWCLIQKFEEPLLAGVGGRGSAL